MQYRLENGREFGVVGMKGLYSPQTKAEIPALWQRFAPHMQALPGRKGWTSYGVCGMEPAALEGKDALLYAAAMETEPDAPVPDGMVRLTIAAGRYAVFTHEGHISGISATWDRIWNAGMPDNALKARAGFQFERYDERWSPATGEGPVEIWIPVE
jgi:AraC family transcriptional regulator